ncbi:helix-turn-helix domain-containing protein [Streptomyces flaveus]|uniref:HTH cro/C1-type domain-containing protein n=1 Tax=Streptomyces flaveus TaxID=66370 RepID=A0A917RDZ1_9ACTN|nr:helix-turn-helix transcriptional regulator [Streptomyces flaveus]GGL03038.1 hypothetical protein GCM10010094_74750 [Streptomyces flaveus]
MSSPQQGQGAADGEDQREDRAVRADRSDASGSEDFDAAQRFGRRFKRLNQVIYPAEQGRPYREREIADEIGMSVSQVSNLLNGRSVPRADRAVALAQRLYGVRVEYFFLPDDDAYVQAVEGDLRAIEQQRRGEPLSRSHRTAGTAAEADALLLGDEQVRSIAEGVAELPLDMRETVGALVDQLRRAVGFHPKDGRGRPR